MPLPIAFVSGVLAGDAVASWKIVGDVGQVDGADSCSPRGSAGVFAGTTGRGRLGRLIARDRRILAHDPCPIAAGKDMYPAGLGDRLATGAALTVHLPEDFHTGPRGCTGAVLDAARPVPRAHRVPRRR